MGKGIIKNIIKTSGHFVAFYRNLWFNNYSEDKKSIRNLAIVFTKRKITNERIKNAKV